MTTTTDTTLIRDRAFLQRVALYFTQKAGFPVSFVVRPGPTITAILHRPSSRREHTMQSETPVAFITELDTLLNTKTKDNHREQLLNKNSDLG